MHIQKSKIPIYRRAAMFLTGATALVTLAAAAAGVGALAPGDSVTYTPVTFNESELTPDRTAPSGGSSVLPNYQGRTNVLEMNVDKDGRSTSGSFYYTEGLKKDISGSTAVKADLYLDNWNGKDVRVGIWGVGTDGSSVSAYPIVEFTSAGDGGYVGWRTFDDENGGWINHGGVPINIPSSSNGWNTIQIEYNSDTSKFDFVINGVDSGSSVATGSTGLSAVIFNQYNYGPDDGANYTVHWSNLETGVIADDTTAPDVAITNPANGSTVSGTIDVRGTVTDANPDHYYLKISGPSGTVYSHTTTETDSITNESLYSWDTTAVADGVYTVRLEARDASGNKDAGSVTQVSVTVDNTKPGVTITSPSNGDVLHNGTFNVMGTAADANGIDRVDYTVTKITALGGTYVSSVASGTATGTNSWNFDVNGLSDGFYRLKVQAFDTAGNWRYKYVDVQVASVPKDKQACKNGGWKTFESLHFKNQGACISYVKHHDGRGDDDKKERDHHDRDEHSHDKDEHSRGRH